MSEKVFGFRKAASCFAGSNSFCVNKDELVPVRLKSESVSVEEHNAEIEKLRKHLEAVIAFRNKEFVSVEWLKKWCKEHQVDKGYNMMAFIHTRDLLSAAEKEAGKKVSVVRLE